MKINSFQIDDYEDIEIIKKLNDQSQNKIVVITGSSSGIALNYVKNFYL